MGRILERMFLERVWDHEQWPRPCAGYLEREPGRLQLNVVMAPGEDVCDVFVHERPDRVEVEILVCGEPDEPSDPPERAAHSESPDRCVTVYLDAPLDRRRVFDLVTRTWAPSLGVA